MQRTLPDNTQHSQQTSMPPVGFEPTISAGERLQTYALDRTATWTGRDKPCRELSFYYLIQMSDPQPKVLAFHNRLHY